MSEGMMEKYMRDVVKDVAEEADRELFADIEKIIKENEEVNERQGVNMSLDGKSFRFKSDGHVGVRFDRNAAALVVGASWVGDMSDLEEFTRRVKKWSRLDALTPPDRTRTYRDAMTYMAALCGFIWTMWPYASSASTNMSWAQHPM